MGEGAVDVFVDDGLAMEMNGWAMSPMLSSVNETLTVDLWGTGAGAITSSPSGLASCTGTAHPVDEISDRQRPSPVLASLLTETGYDADHVRAVGLQHALCRPIRFSEP